MQNIKATKKKCLTNKIFKLQYDKAHYRVLKGKPHKYKQSVHKKMLMAFKHMKLP